MARPKVGITQRSLVEEVESKEAEYIEYFRKMSIRQRNWMILRPYYESDRELVKFLGKDIHIHNWRKDPRFYMLEQYLLTMPQMYLLLAAEVNTHKALRVWSDAMEMKGEFNEAQALKAADAAWAFHKDLVNMNRGGKGKGLGRAPKKINLTLAEGVREGVESEQEVIVNVDNR